MIINGTSDKVTAARRNVTVVKVFNVGDIILVNWKLEGRIAEEVLPVSRAEVG
jgi:hypothetical protein